MNKLETTLATLAIYSAPLIDAFMQVLKPYLSSQEEEKEFRQAKEFDEAVKTHELGTLVRGLASLSSNYEKGARIGKVPEGSSGNEWHSPSESASILRDIMQERLAKITDNAYQSLPPVLKAVVDRSKEIAYRKVN